MSDGTISPGLMGNGKECHFKNTWVTLPIFLGSELHQCDQEMLLSRFSWKSIEKHFFSYISLSLVSEDLFGYIPGIGNHM